MTDFLVPVVLLVAFVLALRLTTRGNYKTLPAREAHALIQSGSVYVLDVRTPGELAGGCLPGSHCIPLGLLGQRLAEVPQGPVLVYCASGMRSRMAASILCKAGHQEVTNMAGGFSDWSRQGLPIVPGPR
jgi:hydroxyacylglutathione hydrolase